MSPVRIEFPEAGPRGSEITTGLRIRNRVIPRRVEKYGVKGHIRNGFLTPLSGCRGKIRTHLILDGDFILFPPYPITVGEALRKVYKSKRNMFYHYFLEKVAKAMLEEGLLLEPASK